MPLQFTLDTNCLLAIEEDRPQAAGVRALAARHTMGSAIVSMAGTTAAERQKDGTFLPNFSLLQERLATAGLGHLSLIKPIAVFDLSYMDWCVFAADDGSDDVALRSIHEVLFTSPFDYADAVESVPEGPERAKANYRWRNRFLDVLGLYTHIRAGGDVFVTSDTNFVKASKRASLAQLGAPVILDPADAEAYAAQYSQP